jgi:PKD repeat protein
MLFSAILPMYFGKALVTWDFGDGITGTGITVNHNYSITGNYTYK